MILCNKNFMSKKSISQYLKPLSAKELIVEIMQLRKLFPNVREYYGAKLSENGEEELLNRYKKIVKNEFMPDRGFGKCRLSVARKAVNDFMKLGKNPLNVADSMLYYVEMGVKYTNAYGDIDESFYNSMELMYEKVAKYAVKYELVPFFLLRFKKIVDDTEGIGWGFHDGLSDTFEEFFGSKK